MTHQLFRSPVNKVFGGVCSGLSTYLNLDITLIRVLFIVLFFFQGLGAFLYIVLWIIVPLNYSDTYSARFAGSKQSSENETEQKHNSNAEDTNYTQFSARQSNNKGRIVAGIILIVIGLMFAADRFLPHLDFEDIFSVVLIISGAALLWHTFKTKEKIQ
ncbi:MAG: PspC domain-containing protein [Melioribacteraceae bacterium]|nr:PspC domain-containing protein [Melioribacteraceae bacterium]